VDLDVSSATQNLVSRTRGFIQDVALAVEDQHSGIASTADDWGRDPQAAARDPGVFAPHLPWEYGGPEFAMSGEAVDGLIPAGLSILAGR
jgi:alkylation response protein AidB-like acyl-CoA dehydrogenase